MFWQSKKTPVIKPDDLVKAIENGEAPVVVDVRSEGDFRAGHIPGAVNIPLDELEQRKSELDTTKTTVFY